MTSTQVVRDRRSSLCSLGRILACVLLLMCWAALRSAAQVRINVLTTQPGNSSNLPEGQRCSLQEAIYSAEFGRNAAIGSTSPDTTYATGCTAGTGLGDTIVLTGETYTFHTLWDGDAHNPFGPTATPIIFKKIIIEGHGSTLQSDQSGYFRLFAVGEVSMTIPIGTNTTLYSGTGDLTLQNVHITGFHVKGGDGARGGGGGLGAGGAIYVGKASSGVPSLTVQNSTFDNNGAMGGNGAAYGIGGGGGLGGNGGSDIYPNLGGGGGGGARGNGGDGGTNPCNSFDCSGGGGGGGTVFAGGNGLNDPHAYGPGPGGFDCGGGGGGPADFHDGGYITNTNGHDATCNGGGGGGGAVYTLGITGDVYGHGGDGKYGGGGGGSAEDAGKGGFGGGGGGGLSNGGDGGFGGGGGAGNGHAGTFGGNANSIGGGGGGALGGAIFIDYGTTVIQNSTFNNNAVLRGLGSSGADNGGDSGGAIFARDGSLTIQNSTISGNGASGAGGGVKILNDELFAFVTFVLQNTIIAGNDAQGCIVTGNVDTTNSTHNLITDNSGCPAAKVTTDPQLSALAPNAPGNTPTMAINPASSAYDAGDDSTALAADQRGVPRPQGAHSDIGAYEFKPFADLGVTKTVSSSTVQAGDTLTYTITLTNHGPNAASNVTVTDTFPSQLTFVSCSATGIGVCATGGGTITYSSLDVNLPETITLKGTMKSGYARGILVMNIASVSGSPDDPVSDNNLASVSSTVIVPDFSLTVGTPVTIAVGGSASSSISVGSLDGFNSAVGLTASGPGGFTNSFNPASVTPPANSSTNSTLTMSLQPSVVPGPYTVTVTGTSGTLTHSAPISVTVQVTLDAAANVINTDVTTGAIDNAGIGTALTSKITAAKNAMSAGQNLVEINTLQALLNEINAQTGKHIKASFTDGTGQTFNPAAVLVTDVNSLLRSAGANIAADPIMGSVLNGNGSGVVGATINLLNSANAIVASATTDAAGFYYFPATAGLTSGATYTAKISTKGYGAATPSSQAFKWGGTAIALKNFVLN